MCQAKRDHTLLSFLVRRLWCNLPVPFSYSYAVWDSWRQAAGLGFGNLQLGDQTSRHGGESPHFLLTNKTVRKDLTAAHIS
jgi:hypothetical protein